MGGLMARTPLIAGNWKMNLDHLQAVAFVQKLHWTLKDAGHEDGSVEVAVFPPYTDLRTVQTLLDADKIPFALGAQDLRLPRREGRLRWHNYWAAADPVPSSTTPTIICRICAAFAVAISGMRRCAARAMRSVPPRAPDALASGLADAAQPEAVRATAAAVTRASNRRVRGAVDMRPPRLAAAAREPQTAVSCRVSSSQAATLKAVKLLM